METLSFGLIIIAIGWVIVWCYQNDPPDGEGRTSGIFAMRSPSDQKAKTQNSAKSRSPKRKIP